MAPTILLALKAFSVNNKSSIPLQDYGFWHHDFCNKLFPYYNKK